MLFWIATTSLQGHSAVARPAHDLNQIEVRNLTWRRTGFGSVVEADFEIYNGLKYPVTDLEIFCVHSGRSGTVADGREVQLLETWNPDETRAYKGHNLGFVDPQGVYTEMFVTEATVWPRNDKLVRVKLHQRIK